MRVAGYTLASSAVIQDAYRQDLARSLGTATYMLSPTPQNDRICDRRIKEMAI